MRGRAPRDSTLGQIEAPYPDLLVVPLEFLGSSAEYQDVNGIGSTAAVTFASVRFSSLVRSSSLLLQALELATLIAGLVTAAAVAGSVLFLARQTRQSVEQFLVANELAGARALAQGYELWDHVITRFIDYPELRQYFYEGVEPPEDSTARARVLAMTELIGDALQSAHWLYKGKDVALLGSVDPELDILVDWDDWTEKILTTSPVMRSFVRENPLMYPHLTRTLDAIEPAPTG